jgi:hypothetical protein
LSSWTPRLEKASDEEGLQGDAAEGRTISLCLEPALFVHPRAELHEDSPVLDATMRRELLFNDQGKRNAVPAVKAVVVILKDI